MKKFFNEFKEFAMRGNVLDMAVGVIIGAAFKAIIDSVVNDLISPIIGIIFKKDFNQLAIEIGKKTLEDGTVESVAIKYGAFITAVINFLIVAFVLFLIVKTANSASKLVKKPEEPKAQQQRSAHSVLPKLQLKQHAVLTVLPNLKLRKRKRSRHNENCCS